MILTCPECATRYFVGDDAVPPGGRTVRCASCGQSWRATPEPTEPLELAPAAAAPPGVALPGMAPGAAAFGKADGPKAPVSKAFRDQVQQKKRTRKAMTAGVAWAGFTAAVVVLVLAAVLFRVQMVRLWPRTAGVYAALHLPVNPTGLALDAVQGQPGLQDGRAVLAISGLERNVEARPRPPSPLKVTLYDKAGGVAAVQMVRPAPGPIAPGETRAFRAVFADPPMAAADFQVELAFDAPPLRPTRAGAMAPAAHAHGAVAPLAAAPPSAVREAAPLPAGSPYALPASADPGAPAPAPAASPASVPPLAKPAARPSTHPAGPHG